MTNRYVHGYIKLTVSQLVEANRKSAALDLAHHRCQEKDMELSRIILQDGDGREYRAFVKKISGVKWFYAEPAECSNQFNVKGKVGLDVYLEVDEDTGDLNKMRLRLQQRLIGDLPTIVFSTGSENVFLRVEQYDVGWELDLIQTDGYLAAV